MVDESGDLGSAGSKFFVIASIVTASSRSLFHSSKLLPNTNIEKKFYNSTTEERRRVLESISQSSVSISYIVSEKNNPSDKNYIYGVDLYKRTLYDLLDDSLSLLVNKDVNIIIDGSRYIQQGELRAMCDDLCKNHGKNLKKCYKGISQNEPCLRLVDYVAGSVRLGYENSNTMYCDIIKGKVSIARRY